MSDGSNVRNIQIECPRSTSANTGVAPQYTTQFAVEIQVNAGTITSSPGPIPNAASAKCNPVVAEVTATASGTQ